MALSDDERDRLLELRGTLEDATQRAAQAFEDVDGLAGLRARQKNDPSIIDLPDPGVVAFQAMRELTVAVQGVADVLAYLLEERRAR